MNEKIVFMLETHFLNQQDGWERMKTVLWSIMRIKRYQLNFEKSIWYPMEHLRIALAGGGRVMIIHGQRGIVLAMNLKMAKIDTNSDISLPEPSLLWYNKIREKQKILPKRRQAR